MGAATPERAEWIKCARSPAYFLDTYGEIYNASQRSWIPFKLWAAQVSTLQTFRESHLVVVLKARQLGVSWLALGYGLWLGIFRPRSTILLFSRRDDEAAHLLNFRYVGMYNRLPEWMRARRVLVNNDHEFQLSTGTLVKAFPTTAGDSYTASYVLVDEADLVPNLSRLMRAVKPTIDAGGQLALVSRADKTTPDSEFKRIYQAAKQPDSEWTPVFLPWYARPDRTPEWYEMQKREILDRTHALDELHEQYPENDAEALAKPTLQRRFAPKLLMKRYAELPPIDVPKFAPLPGLSIFFAPEEGVEYVVGVDPAEGNPTSDPSAIDVLRRDNGEEVAQLNARIEPTELAGYAKTVADLFNGADILVERNNHGHTVIAWFAEHDPERTLLKGKDNKAGWSTQASSKSLMCSNAAEVLVQSDTLIHSYQTYSEMANIDGSTLRALGKDHDDAAMAYMLALLARTPHVKKDGGGWGRGPAS